MARVLHGQVTKSHKPHPRNDSRHAERISFNCRVTYRGEINTQPHAGEGLTKDISLTGLKIVTDRPVTRGTLLTLTVALPDGLPPLSIFSAHVIWVAGVHFSVRFMHLSHDHRKRIQSFIWKHIGKDAVDDSWTRFKIA